MAIIRKLSKTQYVKGLQCPKALWYYINRKDLKPDIDIVTQARFDTGKEIGFLAQKYFSGGKEVTEDYWEIGKAAQTTGEFVKEGYKVIYEAVAINQMDGSYSRIDIFHNNAETNDWDLIEVKSSTKVKDYHLEDISFQYHVFSNAGYKIGKCLLMFINNEYLRQGDIDPKGLFKFEDVTEDVIANQNKIEPILAQLSYVLEQKEEPEEDIGSRCYSPYECDYIHHCWKQVPDYSIYNVYTKKRADEIYSEIISYNVLDIPTDLFPTSIKSIDIDCFQNDKSYIEKENIEQFLNELEYPLYYLDYETLTGAIPQFDRSRPYQQIPFQFSLHVQENPNSKLRHHEFLHKEQTDPRLYFTEKLINSCGSEGSILVYNKTFEITRNRDLAKEFPQYGPNLEAINSRIVDLMEPFRYRWVYKPDQMSSYSIKYVLPAYVPELSYDKLDISDGMDASIHYYRFLNSQMSEAECNTLWLNLSEYCKLDTYAMVALIEALKKLVE